MQRLMILLMANLLLVLLVNSAWSVKEVNITDPQKVAALTGLQEKIDSISTAVGDCMNAGKDHGDCMCKNEKLIRNFNGAVEELFETYPDLKAVEFVNFKMPSGRAISQSMPGIKNQARMELHCK